MVDRDDDLRIGMKTSAITLGDHDVPAIMCFYAVHLVSWAAMLPVAGVRPGVALWACWLLAAGQVVWHVRLIRSRSREGCFRAFRLNHWLGLSLFAGVLLHFGL
jgi:4-hydroxybenzoate polyprenyltransferase